MEEYLNDIHDLIVFDSFVKAKDIINRYDKVMCSISGGADSDVILDICQKIDKDKKIVYVWFDTGLEYQATKDHLKYLEQKYNITIVRQRSPKPIPICCREFGQPFISKYVSEHIGRLQRHNFKWEDRPYEELLAEYPNCKSSLRWWCNEWKEPSDGSISRFCIARNKYLKEFLIKYPPTFKISSSCCNYTKKTPAKKYKKANKIQLSITGVRKSEGGIRAAAYKNCFSEETNWGVSEYRPIFWYNNENRENYEKAFGITHSNCYSEYGMTRTGCAGCPYNQKVLEELAIIEKYEPKLFKAVNNIFKDSYEYTKKYREFVKEMNKLC